MMMFLSYCNFLSTPRWLFSKRAISKPCGLCAPRAVLPVRPDFPGRCVSPHAAPIVRRRSAFSLSLLPQPGHLSRRGVGGHIVGLLLELGPEGNVCAHHAPCLRPARPRKNVPISDSRQKQKKHCFWRLYFIRKHSFSELIFVGKRSSPANKPLYLHHKHYLCIR